MSIAKKKAFNDKMSLKKQYPDHQHLYAKGGVVARFDDGGTVNASTQLSGPSAGINGGGTPNPSSGFAGTIGNALGVNNNYQAGAANIQAGTNVGQLNQAYNATQGALTGQQQLATALSPYAQVAAQNQQQLAGQFATEAAGGGPNVAGTQLNTATGHNIAAQAAQAAGQRGASANVGLIERQAAQQGAATQQQAVGQAASLEQQQEIAAQQNLANLNANQISQGGQAITNATNAQLAEQEQQQAANTAYNNALVSMQGNINQVNAQTAASNQGMASKVIGGVMNAGASALGAIGLAHGGEVHNYDAGGPVIHGSDLGQIHAPGAVSSGGPAMGSVAPIGASQEDFGKDVTDDVDVIKKGYKPGGMKTGTPTAFAGADMDTGAAATGAPALEGAAEFATVYRGGRIASGPHHSHVANYLHGGSSRADVPALVSPKEVYLSPDQVKDVVEKDADPIRIGHHFPGKDRVKGKDSKKNDVIQTTLQDGGVVLPLHITQHKEASKKGRAFVQHAVAKHMKTPKKGM